MKKKIKISFVSFILFFLLTLLIYISDIDNLPSNIILFEGETLQLNTIFGMKVKTEFSSNPNIERIENNETITVTANAEELDYTGNINLSVSLLGAKVKEINVSIVENVEVVPIGNLIGVKLYTNGVLVVGMSEIAGKDNNKYRPYEGTGIEEGDLIVEIDEKGISSTEELKAEIDKSKGDKINVTYIRER